MSSVPDTLSTTGKSGHKSGAREVREALHDHLRKTANFIQLLDALVYAFAWVVIGLAVWLVASVTDHWLLPLPGILRWAIWLAGVSFTGWWFVRFLLPLALGQIRSKHVGIGVCQTIVFFLCAILCRATG